MTNHKHYDNFFGYLAHVFTTNTPLSLIILFSSIILGLLAYWITPKQYNPEVIRPAFVVATEYRGADANEVHDFVSQNIVHDMRQIDGVDEVRSQSFSGGYSMVSVLFDVGENEEASKTKIFTKILENTDIQKEGIGEPSILSINPDDVPIVTLDISSPRYDQNHIREIIFAHIDALETIPGVSDVHVYGGEAPALRIELDKGRMQTLGVSLPEVLHVLESHNKKIFTTPISTGYRTIALELDNHISSAEDLRKIAVRPDILMSDISYVSDTYQEKNSFVELNNRGLHDYQNVFISFAKKKGTSAPQVSRAIQTSVSSIFDNQDIEVSVLHDDGHIAQNEINGLMYNLLISIFIVGIILYLFLSVRPALVVMATIPIILLLVFIPGFFTGQTINRITLFALILSLGLLVDSATVVVENIYRNIKEYPSHSIQANTVRAVNQVGMGLLLSTVTSVAVFIPVRFITGMMGPYMGPIAFFVPVALIISLLVALIITPYIAHQSFKKNNHEHQAPLDSLFATITRWYEKTLTGLLNNRKRMRMILFGLLVAIGIALALPIMKIVHFQMLPKANKDQIYVHIDYPRGTDILINKKYSDHIIQELLGKPDIASVQSFVGTSPIPDFNGLFKGVQNRTGSEQTTLRINLQEKRAKSSIVIAKEVRTTINHVALPVSTAVKVLEDPPGPPVQATFMLEMYGDPSVSKDATFHDIAGILGDVDGLVDLDTSKEEPFEKNILKIDHSNMATLGIALDDLYAAIATVTNTHTISQFHNDTGEYGAIQISFPRDQRNAIEDILDVKISNIYGELVPISEIVDRINTQHDQALYAMNGEVYESITGEVEDRSIVYVVLDVFKKLQSLEEEGYDVRQTSLSTFTIEKDNLVYEIHFAGEWDMTLSNFRDLGIAMIAALFLVYAVLVAQYKSFLIPALIMVTIPLGLVGILFGFTLLDNFFNIYLTATALIGFIALIGIVVNNAILYLEYFSEITEEDPDIDPIQALIESGKVRLRPIMLTSLTTILANLTIISDPVWSGLGWSIIWGLSLSTVMTLIIFPILYIYVGAHTKNS